MDFAESAICTPDVGRSTAEVGPPFADQLRVLLANTHFDSGVKAVVFFPTILAPEVGSMQDKVTYKKNEPAVFVKMNIDHGEWTRSQRQERLKLYVAALVKGIENIRDKTMSATDRATLMAAIDLAASNLARQWQ
jgi:hypothetical protein